MRRLGPVLLASLLILPTGLAAQTADGPPPDDYEDYRWEPGDAPMEEGATGADEPPMRQRFRDRLAGGEEGMDREALRQRMRERFRRGRGGFGGGGGGRFGGGAPGGRFGGGRFAGGRGGPGGHEMGGPGMDGPFAGRGMRKGRGGKGRGAGRGGLGKQMLARVRELDPALADDMAALQDKVPPQARKRLMHEVMRNMKQFVKESMAGGMGGDRQGMRETIQQVAVMELRTLTSAMQARFGGADPEATKTRLRGELETLFDRKVSLQEQRMQTMRKKLADLEKMIAERRTHKAKIVDQRLAELMGTQEKFQW